MIYTLTVECVWGIYLKEACVRVIEIDEEASLDDLHCAIQKAVAFDNDHLYEFYAGRNPRNRTITFGEPAESPFEVPATADIPLNRVYPLPERMKLIYLFDFGDSWTFQITKARQLKEPEPRVKYPRLIERKGPNPVQYPNYDEE